MTDLNDERKVTIIDMFFTFVSIIIVYYFAIWLSHEKRILICQFYLMIMMLQILFFAYNKEISQATIRFIVIIILILFLFLCIYLNITNMKESFNYIINILLIPHPYSITGYLISSFLESNKD